MSQEKPVNQFENYKEEEWQQSLKQISDLYNLNLKQEDYDKFLSLTKEQRQSVLNEVLSQHQPNPERTSTKLEASTPDFDVF